MTTNLSSSRPGAHQRRSRAGPGAETTATGAARACIARSPPLRQPRARPVDPIHRVAGDDVEATVLVGGDRVRHRLDLTLGPTGAVLAVDGEGAQVLVGHALGLSRHYTDHAVLGSEGDAPVIGHRDADELVVAAQRRGGEVESAQQSDGRVAPARDGVTVDLECSRLPDVETVVGVDEVVRPGDRVRPWSGTLLHLRDVLVDHRDRLWVDLEDLIGEPDGRCPDHPAPVGILGRERQHDRRGREAVMVDVDLLGRSCGARERGGRLGVGVPVIAGPRRGRQVPIARRLRAVDGRRGLAVRRGRGAGRRCG